MAHFICTNRRGEFHRVATESWSLGHVTKTMMEDERGKKLLSNLKAAFVRDPNIDEYDFLPVLEPKHNCNPLVLVEHKLGVEIWACKVLFDYAYQRLIHWRRRLPQSRDIVPSCGLISPADGWCFTCKHIGLPDPNGLLNLTRAVLMINPDNATAWNVRKELVQSKVLSPSEDLKLGSLILTRHPKSPEAFAHRKWLLSQRKAKLLERLNPANGAEPNSNINDNQLMVSLVTCNDGHTTTGPAGLPPGFALNEQVRAEVRREIEVSRDAAQKYPNNYNAWSHRIWVLQTFTSDHRQVLMGELQQTERWVCQHVSDYSGFHYRQYLLTGLGCHTDQLEPELLLVADLITSYPGHEALWYHRRAIVRALMAREADSPSSRKKKTATVAITQQAAKKSRVLPHRDRLVEREEAFCERAAAGRTEAWQRTLAERHRSWMKKTFSSP